MTRREFHLAKVVLDGAFLAAFPAAKRKEWIEKERTGLYRMALDGLRTINEQRAALLLPPVSEGSADGEWSRIRIGPFAPPKDMPDGTVAYLATIVLEDGGK